jgi:ABC-type glycerol-3-phosphate transport system substrate-binding protein
MRNLQRTSGRAWPGKSLKTTALLLSFILVTLILAACGDNTATAPAAASTTAAASATTAAGTGATTAAATTAAASGPMVELTYDMNDSAIETPGWQAQVDAANKILAAKNIHIKVQKIPNPNPGWTDYYTKVAAEIAAGKSPDIGRVAESLLPQLIAKNQIVDLSDTVKQLDASQFFEKTFQNAGYKDGKYYGIPSGSYHMVMYYNKDMLDKAGIKLSQDWEKGDSFATIAQYARQLTSGSGGSKIFGLSAAPYMAYIGMYAVSNGGKNVFNADGTCALTDPASKEVYNWFDQMLRTDKSMPTPADNTVQAPLDMFMAGRVGMLIDGTWDLQPLNGVTKFKVGAAVIPSGKGKSVSTAFTDSFVVFKGSAHEAEAREALLALNSAEGISAVSAKGVGGVPVRKDVLNANLDQLIGPKFTDADRTTIINGLNYTQPVPYNVNYQQIDDELNAVMDTWRNGKITTDQWATQACSIVNKPR